MSSIQILLSFRNKFGNIMHMKAGLILFFPAGSEYKILQSGTHDSNTEYMQIIFRHGVIIHPQLHLLYSL